MTVPASCPLCDTAAYFAHVHTPAGKRFMCPICTDFFIETASEATLSGFPEGIRSERRAKLSNMAASAGPARFLVIRKPKSSKIAHESPGLPQTNMIIEFVNRA